MHDIENKKCINYVVCDVIRKLRNIEIQSESYEATIWLNIGDGYRKIFSNKSSKNSYIHLYI